MLTIEQLKLAYPRMAANPNTCQSLFPYLVQALEEFEINTRLRICAWLGQVAIESGQFRYHEEVWGPTPQQRPLRATFRASS